MLFVFYLNWPLFLTILVAVWVGPLVVKELKRIVEASEITKYVGRPQRVLGY